LLQGQGREKVHPTGKLKYSEALKRGSSEGIGQKNIFEIASNKTSQM